MHWKAFKDFYLGKKIVLAWRKALGKTLVHSLLYYLLAFPKRSKQSSQATEISTIAVTFSSQIFQGDFTTVGRHNNLLPSKMTFFLTFCAEICINTHFHCIRPRHSVSENLVNKIRLDSRSSETDINWISWSCKDPWNN